ncbi:hypothetical protein M4D79_05700 [Mycolicibacterium novocastrense]|nr:hypothetical protein M4D79_05700 [Mycolicibacterium novocastrense]
MDFKKLAVTTTMTGALGLSALGLSTGIAQAQPDLPQPPPIPVPEVHIPDVTVPGVNVPDVNVPNVNVPDVDIPTVNVPDVDIPTVNVPDVDVPQVNVSDVELPEVKFPEVDNYFKLPHGHIPPGQLKNSPFINGVPNPFYGIPPGQLKKLPEVNEIPNPFFDEKPGHWSDPRRPDRAEVLSNPKRTRWPSCRKVGRPSPVGASRHRRPWYGGSPRYGLHRGVGITEVSGSDETREGV